LGGLLPAESRQHLEHSLAEEIQRSQEEVLVSVSLPPLEDYQSPARLVALTRQALVVLDEEQAANQSPVKNLLKGMKKRPAIQLRQYPLRALSSVQLRYSLVGSSLSFAIPQPQERIQRYVIPFHSPAIARMLPLFTRLLSALSQPYHT
jgi:hypothetical protein